MAKRIVIVGATSTIAEQCVRLWGAQPDIEEFVFIGRDENKLKALSEDIKVRFPKVIIDSRIVRDFCDDKIIQTLIKEISSRPIDTALIAHGILGEQSQSQTDFKLLRQVIDINVTSLTFFAEAIVSVMLEQGYGTLGIISSIAGDKARKRNYHYGSAKALVSFFCAGLQHRLVGSNIKICLIKPGPTRSPMTSHMPGLHLAQASLVAQDIVKGMDKGKRIIYTPWKWRYVMFILRHLPWVIFKQMAI